MPASKLLGEERTSHDNKGIRDKENDPKNSGWTSSTLQLIDVKIPKRLFFIKKIDQDNRPDEKVCSKTSDKKSPINRYKIKIGQNEKNEK